MLRPIAATLAALVMAAPAGAAGPLERYAPVVVHDSRERAPLSSVDDGEPTVYGRRAGRWLQYWMYFPRDDQDRGIVRTGRHAGDWEMVQYAVDGSRLLRGVYAQHSGAERCPAGAIRTSRGRPVVFLANGSHAAYFVPGLRDRTWPDPNDEADGRGARVRPRLVRITAGSPAWMRDDRRWGAARARWIPGEMDSPPGPAFQPQTRWSDPDAWAREARACTREDCDERGECDGRETALSGLAAGAGFLLALAYGWRRSRGATMLTPPRAARSGARG